MSDPTLLPLRSPENLKMPNKALRRAALAAAVVSLSLGLASSCGGKQAAKPPPVVVVDDGATPVDFRLRGYEAAGFTALLVETEDVTVLADGKPVVAAGNGAVADLAQTDQAWKLATIRVPKDAQTIELRVRLHSAAAFEAPTENGELDARNVVLRAVVPAEQLRTTGKVTLELDISRSVIPLGKEKRALVPQYRHFI